MRRLGVAFWMASAALWASGCVTVAEHRKLEREVYQLKRGGASGGESVADLRAQVDALERRLAKVEGRVDETQHTAQRALEEAQHAPREAATGAVVEPSPTPEAEAPTPPAEPRAESTPESTTTPAPSASAAARPAAPSENAEAPEPAPAGASVQEVSAYREAHASYRNGEYDACIDRFRRFLQTYPTSPYADDAAYWMAECHFKKGDYKSAVLRFDDVVARYPDGDKSADALYRQGEALLKLGPSYAKAASKAFERVISEYPNSPRVAEAKKQLELLGSRG